MEHLERLLVYNLMAILRRCDAQFVRLCAASLDKRLDIATAEVLRSKIIRQHNIRLLQLREVAKKKTIAAQVLFGSPLSVADIDLLIDQIERL